MAGLHNAWRALFVITITVVVVLATTSQVNKSTSSSSSSSVDIIADSIRYLYTDFGARLILTLENISDDLPTIVLKTLTVPNIVQAVFTLGLAYLAYYLYRQLFLPYKVIKLYEGYMPDVGQSKKDTANEMRRRRRVGDMPPIYPNGWFSVLRSDDLKPGDVKYVSALGKNIETVLIPAIPSTNRTTGAPTTIGHVYLPLLIASQKFKWIFR